MFCCKSDTLCATDRVSVFHRERMRGGPGGVCNEYTRLGTKLTNATASRPLRRHCHRHTPQSAMRRSGDFMACTVITLWVETAVVAVAVEARSQVSDSDYNFFFFLQLLLIYPPASPTRTHRAQRVTDPITGRKR